MSTSTMRHEAFANTLQCCLPAGSVIFAQSRYKSAIFRSRHLLLGFLLLVVFLAPQSWGLEEVKTSGSPRIVPQIRHSRSVQALAASADGALLLSGDSAGNVKVWSVSSATAVAEYSFGSHVSITAAAFHTRHVDLVALSIQDERYEGHRVVLFDLARGLETASWAGAASALAFSPNGRYLAGKSSSAVFVWDAEGKELLFGLEGIDGRGIGFRDAVTVAYRDRFGIRFLDVRNGATKAILPSENGKDFAIFDNGRRLLDLRDDIAVLWDLERGLLITEIEALLSDDKVVTAVDGSVAFVASDSANLFGDVRFPLTMLSGDGLSKVTGLVGLTSIADSLLFRDGLLYLGQRDGRIRRWQLAADGSLSLLSDLGHWSPPIEALAVSVDRRLMALGDSEGVVDVFDTISGIRRSYDPYEARPLPPEPNYGDVDRKGIVDQYRYGEGPYTTVAVEALQFEADGYAL